MRFPPKALIVCPREQTGFDYMKNHECGKLANFWLKTISKINFKMRVVITYTFSELRSKKI